MGADRVGVVEIGHLAYRLHRSMPASRVLVYALVASKRLWRQVLVHALVASKRLSRRCEVTSRSRANGSGDIY